MKDGGPAFPSWSGDGEKIAYVVGMSLRDYFAAAALQGIMSNPEVHATGLLTAGVKEVGTEQLVQYAFFLASTMVKESQK